MMHWRRHWHMKMNLFQMRAHLLNLGAFVMVIYDGNGSAFQFTDPNFSAAWCFHANPIRMICSTNGFLVVIAFVLNDRFPLSWCTLNHEIDSCRKWNQNRNLHYYHFVMFQSIHVIHETLRIRKTSITLYNHIIMMNADLFILQWVKCEMIQRKIPEMISWKIEHEFPECQVNFKMKSLSLKCLFILFLNLHFLRGETFPIVFTTRSPESLNIFP